MKVGVRKPNLKKRIRARTTGKIKRKVKQSVIPGYGKKGAGWVKNPKKALYNKVYNKTTVSVDALVFPKNGHKTTYSKRSATKKRSGQNQVEYSPTTYRISSVMFAILASIMFFCGIAGAPFLFIICIICIFFAVIHWNTANELSDDEVSDDSEVSSTPVYHVPTSHATSNGNADVFSRQYFSNMDKIENEWSVLLKNNTFNSDAGNDYISLCRKNIDELDFWVNASNDGYPPLVPAYKRLAMIYEKRGDYQKAIDVCQEAISKGITTDGTKGGMNGRIQRLQKKLK